MKGISASETLARKSSVPIALNAVDPMRAPVSAIWSGLWPNHVVTTTSVVTVVDVIGHTISTSVVFGCLRPRGPPTWSG
jgi:hypothetical protein